MWLVMPVIVITATLDNVMRGELTVSLHQECWPVYQQDKTRMMYIIWRTDNFKQ